MKTPLASVSSDRKEMTESIINANYSNIHDSESLISHNEKSEANENFPEFLQNLPGSNNIKQDKGILIPSILNSNSTSTVDNIRNAFLNDFNETRNEIKKIESVCSDNSSQNSLKSIDLNEKNPSKIVSILNNVLQQKSDKVMLQDDLGFVIKEHSTNISNNIHGINNQVAQTEGMNISYNFSNINQMNINISIANIKDLFGNEIDSQIKKEENDLYFNNDDKTEKDNLNKDSGKKDILLRKKRSRRSSSRHIDYRSQKNDYIEKNKLVITDNEYDCNSRKNKYSYKDNDYSNKKFHNNIHYESHSRSRFHYKNNAREKRKK